jgi:fatty acid desaturase
VEISEMKISTRVHLLLCLLVATTSAFNVNRMQKVNNVKVKQPGAVAIPLEVSIEDTKLSAKDSWILNLDYDAFAKEVTNLGKKLQKSSNNDDVEHLNKIVEWTNIACILGVSTMWMSPNPITVAALSTWTYSSWLMIAHHTCHGGYNRVDAGKYNSRGFSLGSIPKRVADWCDWMLPEAWNIEHNRLHHYHLGEPLDPDLVERNLTFLRDMKIPLPLKYVVAAALMPVWKWFYYAPNTYKELTLAKLNSEKKELPEGLDPYDALTLKTMFFPETKAQELMNEIVPPKEFFQKVLAPFFVTRFLLLPAPLLFIPDFGGDLFFNAMLNLILADLLTNIHGFVTVVTNHAGEDLYKFEDEVKPKSGAFYVRQIVSSTNYDTGTDVIDFSHGWLNYQIEHHVWPDLSMLQYQKGQPELKAICNKYGVPYVQENVFERLRKTVDIMVGRTNMRRFPTELEPQKDKAISGVTWKSTDGAIDGI